MPISSPSLLPHPSGMLLHGSFCSLHHHITPSNPHTPTSHPPTHTAHNTHMPAPHYTLSPTHPPLTSSHTPTHTSHPHTYSYPTHPSPHLYCKSPLLTPGATTTAESGQATPTSASRNTGASTPPGGTYTRSGWPATCWLTGSMSPSPSTRWTTTALGATAKR